MSGRTGVCAWRAGRRREFSCITNIEPTDVEKVRRIAEAVGSLEIKKTERRTDESVEVWRIVRRFRRRIVTGEEGGRSMYGGRDRRRIGFGRHNRPAFADGPDGRCGR